MVIAAEQHATRLVVPSSQRMPATRWSSHKDIAAKALKKLAGPHVPVSLTKLEQAVNRAHAAYDKAETAAREQQRAACQAAEPETDDGIGDELDEDLDEAAYGRCRPLAGRLATRWSARPGGRAVARDRPATGGGPQPEGSPRWPAASTASR